MFYILSLGMLLVSLAFQNNVLLITSGLYAIAGAIEIHK